MRLGAFIEGVDRPGTTVAAETARLRRASGGRILDLISSGTRNRKPAKHVIEVAIQAARENSRLFSGS